MSTPEEKAKNRAKQARFQARHPGYSDACHRKKHPKKLEIPAGGVFCTFELADPRDELLLPRYIGCGPVTDPVWKHLWAMKDISYGRWAAWLRELASLKLTPVALDGWACGKGYPLEVSLAVGLVADRIKYITKLAGEYPPWLLNSCGGIGRIKEGKIERFPRTMKNWKNYFIYSGKPDPQGNVWFED